MFVYRSHVLAMVTLTLLGGILWTTLAQAPPHRAAQGFTALPTPILTPIGYQGTPHPMSGVPAATSSTGATLTSADIARFVMSHGIPGDMGRGSPTITKNEELTSQQVKGVLQNATLDAPDGTLLWYVELSGQFRFPGPSQNPSIAFTTAFEVFFADSGNLVMEGGLATPTGNPTGPPSPTDTPTSTPTPIPTKLPRATATPTPLFTCREVGRGTAQLNARLTFFDVDGGQTSTAELTSTDLQWDNPTDAVPLFAPANGAALTDFGAVSLSSVTCARLRQATYTATRLTAAVNDVFGVQTNMGQYALISVQSLANGQLLLAWETWTIA